MLYDALRGLAQLGTSHDHRNRSRDYNGLGRNLRSRTPPVTNLLVGLVDYWPMIEPGGGGNNLTVTGRWTGTLLQADSTPAIGQGNANSLALVGVNGATGWQGLGTAPWQFSTTLGMTIACWVNFTSLPIPGSGATFASKDDASANREWSLFASGTSPNILIRFNVGSGGSFATGMICNKTWTPQPTAGNWYFVVGVYDPSIPQAQVFINNLSQGTAAQTGVPSVTTTVFQIGKDLRAGNTNAFAGRIQRVGYWKRALSTDEITYLYNGGSGRDFPFN